MGWRMRAILVSLNLRLLDLQRATGRGPWIWAGHLGVSFHRMPGFDTKLMIKRGARRGIRVSQFGPLVVTWPENR